MKKLLKYVLLILIGVIAFLLTSLMVLTQVAPRLEHPECYSSGGKWTTFPTGCVDRCGAQVCTEEFTEGCDCGESGCWDGNSCRFKVYDWEIELILCNRCNNYEREDIPQEQLEIMKKEYLSNFENDQVVFDKFRYNGFYVKSTNKELDKVLSTNITIKSGRISSVYVTPIINKKLQKSITIDSDLVACEEDRECILVPSACCGCGQKSINKAFYESWNDQHSKGCENILCTLVACQDISKPKCVNGKCQVVQ